jgi:hypothetical protein
MANMITDWVQVGAMRRTDLLTPRVAYRSSGSGECPVKSSGPRR